MSAGITTQYGFLYQRYAFVKTVLDNIGMDKFFVYEGLDDIDVVDTDKIMSVSVSRKTFIQVKSGTVSKDCWSKVIGNWLLVNEDDSNHKVILENELSFNFEEEELISHVCGYFIAGEKKKPTSIANKVYKKWVKDAKAPEKRIRELVLRIVNSITLEVISLGELKESIESSFKEIYCQDIIIYNMAKTCRCERFVDCLNTEIDSSLEKKKKYTLRYQDFVKLINRVTSEISDKKYTINTSEMRKRKKEEAEKLVGDDMYREVRQLRLVSPNEGFIVGELVKELLYKDFRNVYTENESILISNMEDIAYLNYEDACFNLPENPSAKEVFNETVNRNIPSQIVDNSPIYRNGCYVYLTSEEADEDKQISWGKENE